MEASAMAVLPVFFVNRDEELHKRAYQRAIKSRTHQAKKWFDLAVPETFKLSIDTSGTRIAQEKRARERILQLQAEINK